mgnify:CR=1 FL=1
MSRPARLARATCAAVILRQVRLTCGGSHRTAGRAPEMIRTDRRCAPWTGRTWDTPRPHATHPRSSGVVAARDAGRVQVMVASVGPFPLLWKRFDHLPDAVATPQLPPPVLMKPRSIAIPSRHYRLQNVAIGVREMGVFAGGLALEGYSIQDKEVLRGLGVVWAL